MLNVDNDGCVLAGPGDRVSIVCSLPLIMLECFQMSAYAWDNRIRFLVRYIYDLDNNGYLNKGSLKHSL